jgi:hypothetical protein
MAVIAWALLGCSDDGRPDGVTRDTRNDTTVDGDAPVDPADVPDAPVDPGSDATDGTDTAPACDEHADCDDGNPCTADECLMAEGTCRFTPMADGEPCDDGDFCNGFEACVSGSCESSGDPCEAPGMVCIVGTCDEAADTCDVGDAPDGTDCDNGVWCDGPDTCVSGACESGPSPCTGGDGICSFATCDEMAGTCDTVVAADGTSCDDGDPCNGSDSCLAGTCVLDPHRPCDDRNPCTTDACGPDGFGGIRCDHVDSPAGTACSDIDTCAGSAGRVCVPVDISSPVCAAGTDALCSDGSLCTVTDCRAGTCSVVSPTPPPPALACGGSLDGSTFFGASDVSSYGSCGSGMTGGENVMAIAAGSGITNIQLDMTDVHSSGTLSAMLLSDHCTPSSCLGAAPAGTTLSVTVTPGATYYVVVDGASNARGAYTISATCW